MAKLLSNSLSLEVKYKGFRHGWVEYSISFMWEDESLINDNVLKRSGDYWGSRSKGTFLANEYRQDTLTETIEKVLETDKPEYWEPMEPDVVFTIYPEMYFPFLEPHWQVAWESEQAREQREKHEKEKREKGKLPDDAFTIIVFIDAYNFRNCTAYRGEGVSLHIVVERAMLESFCRELKAEYLEFKKEFKVDEYKED